MRTAAVGIDLGTTFSAVAIVNEHGIPEVLPNAEGDRITPSVILFEDQDVIVGTYAKQAATVYPEQVVEFVKRHMGEDDYRFRWKDKEYSPEDLSHFILAKLKHDAELRLGVPVDRAVITVPAYFNDKQRRATLLAGKQAGLEVLALLNEPTAAAFAYGLVNQGKDQRVLVFDLGGGTFDVTVVDIADKEINVLATTGDHLLGGKDWDDAIIDHVAGQFAEKFGVDPRTDLVSLADLRAKAVSAKISLSRRPKVNVFHDFQGHVLRSTIAREEFEGICATLLGRVEKLTVQVLADAKISVTDVDTVLLAGGSTRMPMVKDMLERVFGKPPATDINPDEAIALGAALTAAIESARRTGGPSPVDIRTHDVTSHSLGLAAVRSGRLANARIVDKNTRVPAERTRDDIITTYDQQTCVDLWLVQGESDDPLGCTVLGHFEFYGIPPRPAGRSRLSVTYRYNANAIVEVEAMDLETGQTLPYRVASSKVSLRDVAEGRSPRQIVLVVDGSGSMYGPGIAEAKAAGSRLANGWLTKANQRVAVVSCPGGVRQMPTSEGPKVLRAIEQIVAVGATPLAGTLDQASTAMEPEAGVARVVVVLTDGRLDDVEAVRAQVERLRAQGTTVELVASGPSPDLGALKRLAAEGAAVHTSKDSIELGTGYANLATWAPRGG